MCAGVQGVRADGGQSAGDGDVFVADESRATAASSALSLQQLCLL